jgi:hypothetical protein
MIGVDAEHPKEVALTRDHQPVKTFGSHGPDPALGDRVGFGGADRRFDDLGTFR